MADNYMYKFKAVFTVYEDDSCSKVLATFENDEVYSNDKSDHAGIFGDGHRKAVNFVEENGGKGVIVRNLHTEINKEDYYANGVYLTKRF